MLYEIISNIIIFILKFILWILIAFAAVPFGIFMLLFKLFPVFSHDAGFWYWSVFGILTVIAYIILWKPIVWIVSLFSIMGGAGSD